MATPTVISGTTPVPIRLELDCSLTESHRREVEVAKHPLERGADVADHIRFRGRMFEVVGIVSNTPIVSRLESVRPSVADGDVRSRAEDAYRALENAMRAGTVCTIETSLVRYEGMVLVGLAVPRDAQRGNIAELQMTWEELLFAETIRVDAPEPRDASRGNRADTGKQGTTEAKETVKRSVLSSIGGALFGD